MNELCPEVRKEVYVMREVQAEYGPGSTEPQGQSLAGATLRDAMSCVWKPWGKTGRVVVLSHAESLGEEPRGYYVLVEPRECPDPLLLKDILSDYPALLQFLDHAGCDPLSGWK